MEAVVINQFGGPEVIHAAEVATPSVGPEDVLIQVAATSFNPIDVALRSGLFAALFQPTFPYTLGLDVAGVVVRVGDSVTNFQFGDSVYAYLDLTRNGAAAEFVAAKASDVAHAPISLPLGDVAALPLVASTAWQALFEHGQLQAGQQVLITAAAGGVGTIAVQLAKWKGAYVIATASERNFALLQSLGADQLIDYTKETPQQAQLHALDLIINLSPVATPEVNQLLSLLKPGGMLVSAAKPADVAEADRLGVRTLRMASQRKAGQLTELATLIDQGIIKPVISERWPVSDLSQVHQRVGQTHGKVVLIVDTELAKASGATTKVLEP